VAVLTPLTIQGCCQCLWIRVWPDLRDWAE